MDGWRLQLSGRAREWWSYCWETAKGNLIFGFIASLQWSCPVAWQGAITRTMLCIQRQKTKIFQFPVINFLLTLFPFSLSFLSAFSLSLLAPPPPTNQSTIHPTNHTSTWTPAGVHDAPGAGGLWCELGDVAFCPDPHSHCCVWRPPWLLALAAASWGRHQPSGRSLLGLYWVGYPWMVNI